MSETIYGSDFARHLPRPLTHDAKMLALARAAAAELLEVSGLAEAALIYPRLSGLPEELIDILAHDMNISWYDYSYHLETKRRVLAEGAGMHRKMGTKGAVERAVAAVHGAAEVREWFEYGGEPYHFKITVDVRRSGLAEGTPRQIEEKMRMYKNLRSRCDGIFYRLGVERAAARAAAAQGMGARLKVKPLLPGGIGAAARPGFAGFLREEACMRIRPREGG